MTKSREELIGYWFLDRDTPFMVESLHDDEDVLWCRNKETGLWAYSLKHIRDNLCAILHTANCGCVVQAIYRMDKLPLYILVGQTTGITENPFAAGSSSESYMAKAALHSFCPHIDGEDGR